MLDKRFEIKHEHEDMLTIGVELLQAWSIVQRDMDIEAKHYTFKLGHKFSNNGKHLNLLRWIIKNKSKIHTTSKSIVKDEERTYLDKT